VTRVIRAVLLGALLLVAAACGPGGQASRAPGEACTESPAPAETPEGWDVTSQSPSLFPQVINPSGTVTCDGTRLMFSFLDKQNVPAAKPDLAVDVKFFDLGVDAANPVAQGPATFIWAIEPRVGVYVIDIALPTAGTYGIEFALTPAGGSAETIRVVQDVQLDTSVVSIGDKAPASVSPTLADVGGDIAKISTDDDPVPAFYETSIAQAVAAKTPFVVAFATPKFCVSQQCGPTLDRLKPFVERHPEVTFINVEPYQLQAVDGQLQPVLTNDQLTPAAVTNEWKLPTEPWVFVVDREGVVRGSFMLIFSDEELEAAIAAVE
jgi:hypothetical protein